MKPNALFVIILSAFLIMSNPWALLALAPSHSAVPTKAITASQSLIQKFGVERAEKIVKTLAAKIGDSAVLEKVIAQSDKWLFLPTYLSDEEFLGWIDDNSAAVVEGALLGLPYLRNLINTKVQAEAALGAMVFLDKSNEGQDSAQLITWAQKLNDKAKSRIRSTGDFIAEAERSRGKSTPARAQKPSEMLSEDEQAAVRLLNDPDVHASIKALVQSPSLRYLKSIEMEKQLFRFMIFRKVLLGDKEIIFTEPMISGLQSLLKRRDKDLLSSVGMESKDLKLACLAFYALSRMHFEESPEALAKMQEKPGAYRLIMTAAFMQMLPVLLTGWQQHPKMLTEDRLTMRLSKNEEANGDGMRYQCVIIRTGGRLGGEWGTGINIPHKDARTAFSGNIQPQLPRNAEETITMGFEYYDDKPRVLAEALKDLKAANGNPVSRVKAAEAIADLGPINMVKDFVDQILTEEDEVLRTRFLRYCVLMAEKEPRLPDAMRQELSRLAALVAEARNDLHVKACMVKLSGLASPNEKFRDFLIESLYDPDIIRSKVLQNLSRYHDAATLAALAHVATQDPSEQARAKALTIAKELIPKIEWETTNPSIGQTKTLEGLLPIMPETALQEPILAKVHQLERLYKAEIEFVKRVLYVEDKPAKQISVAEIQALVDLAEHLDADRMDAKTFLGLEKLLVRLANTQDPALQEALQRLAQFALGDRFGVDDTKIKLALKQKESLPGKWLVMNFGRLTDQEALPRGFAYDASIDELVRKNVAHSFGRHPASLRFSIISIVNPLSAEDIERLSQASL